MSTLATGGGPGGAFAIVDDAWKEIGKGSGVVGCDYLVFVIVVSRL